MCVVKPRCILHPRVDHALPLVLRLGLFVLQDASSSSALHGGLVGILSGAHAFALNVTSDEMFKATEVVQFPKSHVTRRFAVIHVVPGADTVQNALAIASAGDELVLEDGTYALSSTVETDKSITIRALNDGQAILDGRNARRVLWIMKNSEKVVLQGLHITKGDTVSSLLSRLSYPVPSL